MDHTPLKGIEYYSGWEKTLDKKRAVKGSSPAIAGAFSHMQIKGRSRDWMPSRGPRRGSKETARVDAALRGRRIHAS